MPVSSPSPQRLPHLDGLRGIAAISVVLYHVHNLFGLTLGFERAYLFVDVFFILSGFVLTRAWADDFTRGVDDREILKARIRRLWPTMAIASLLGAAIHLLLGDIQNVWPLLLLALLLIPSIGQNGTIYPLNGPQWSIFWELAANLVHVRWLRRLSSCSLRIFAWAIGLCTCGTIVFCGANTAGPNGDLWWFAAARVGWSYSIGMLFASTEWNAGRWPVLSWWHALTFFMIGIMVLPHLPISTTAGDILFTIFLSPGLFGLLLASRPPVRSSRRLSQLGALSFPLYAVHLPLLTLFAAFALSRGAAAALAVSAALCLSALLSGSNGRRQAERKSGRARAAVKV
jgi:peptidoglycan/LPS O-acetylase OafA/YrhL